MNDENQSRIDNPTPSRLRWLPALLLPILALPALWVFWVVKLPKSVDGMLHLLRVIALDHYFRHGVAYPRWTPLLARGYGYPVFNFYAPGTYYLALALQMAGLTQIDALLTATVLLILLGGYGMYLMALDLLAPAAPRLRPWAALLAATAYMLSPYLLTNAYIRGGFAEVGGQALLPWVFWSIRRLLRADHPVPYVLAVALSLGGLALSHNITLLFVAPTALVYVIFLGIRERSPRKIGWALLGLAAAAGVSAFFWLPVIAERGFLSPAAYDTAAAFVGANTWTWQTFMDWGWRYTYTSATPFRLGLVQSILALAGFWLMRRRPAEWWFWAAVLLISLFGISQGVAACLAAQRHPADRPIPVAPLEPGQRAAGALRGRHPGAPAPRLAADGSDRRRPRLAHRRQPSVAVPGGAAPARGSQRRYRRDSPVRGRKRRTGHQPDR